MKKKNITSLKFFNWALVAIVVVLIVLAASSLLNGEKNKKAEEIMPAEEEVVVMSDPIEMYDPDVSEEYIAKIENYKNEVLKTTQNLTYEQAINDGFVIVGNTGVENKKNLESFIKNTAEKKEDEVRLLFCRGDFSSILVRYIKYDGSRYYGVVDQSRYKGDKSSDYVEFEYPNLKVYEVEAKTADKDKKLVYNCVYLVEDENLTYDDICRMDSELDADAWEKYLYVCEYEK